MEGKRILDVGSGSGWTTALLANLTGKSGEVYGVERVKELVQFGQKNLEKYNFMHARIEHAERELGYPDKGPFDKILVSAAAQELPKSILDQLGLGGALVIPIRNSICKVLRSGDGFEKEEFYGFSFVPLIEGTAGV